jgi:RimJ/RimL family protein N-acetyltransferase
LGDRKGVSLSPFSLRGRFVALEPLEIAHLQPLLACANGPQGSYALTRVPRTEAEMRSYVDEALADRAAGRAHAFATTLIATGEVVGSTRFANLERWAWTHAQASGIDAVEIGWTWLAAAHQRSVVNTEAKRLMLAYAFEVWQVRRVTLKTDARNLRSRAAIERLGAHLDGILRAHLPAADAPVPRDSAVYSILAAEWPAIRERLDRSVVLWST